ncbi:hypothetical protein [Cellulomonas sp. B6]|uniref:hypothetical protein n=1 Tax=Cellulomonas sp. B6 TaxID=1295626 RepID=UPI00073C14F8|nr:hypothetical protein [Cellulomonas sp. B6]KSW30289.1 hypothetical protein ATM99_03900 [Cellulomonas sp. B6]
MHHGRSGLAPLLAVGLVIVVGVVALLVAGPLAERWARTDRSCEDLVPRAEVEADLAAKADAVAELEALSPDVRVGVGEPCAEQPGMARIEVTYGPGTPLDVVRRKISTSGFDAPLALLAP